MFKKQRPPLPISFSLAFLCKHSIFLYIQTSFVYVACVYIDVSIQSSIKTRMPGTGSPLILSSVRRARVCVFFRRFEYQYFYYT